MKNYHWNRQFWQDEDIEWLLKRLCKNKSMTQSVKDCRVAGGIGLPLSLSGVSHAADVAPPSAGSQRAPPIACSSAASRGQTGPVGSSPSLEAS